MKKTDSKKQTSIDIKRLVLTAVLIALATGLSMIKIWQMPLGGSVTLLSMLPIALISIEYGVAWGITGAFISSLVQMMLSIAKVLSWGLSPAAIVGTVLLDYILAYTVIGFSGIFRKKGTPGICIGVFIAILARFVCHLTSGTIIFDIWLPDGWANPFIYSLCYNGLYMLPELVLTMLGAVLLFKAPGFNKLVSNNME